MITLEKLREYLEYNPDTGILTWRVNRNSYGGKVKIGAPAGTLDHDNSLRIRVDGKRYGAHRLAWLLMMGEWPSNEVDHIDGDANNNRWSNLRLATHGQNMRNRKKPSNNSSGFKGVCFDGRKGLWRARITSQGKETWLGYFDTPEEAGVAYAQAAKKYHGEFARVG